MSGRSWILVVAVVGSLLGLLLLADACERRPGGGGEDGEDGQYFEAVGRTGG